MSDIFQPEQLHPLLQPLQQRTESIAPQFLDYQRYYGIDLSGRHGSLDWRLGTFHSGDYRIAVQMWAPDDPKGTLLLLHGYYDHMALYRNVIDWALGMNLAVLACDLPGHGLSSGPRASINDFAEYQEVLSGLLDQAERLGLPAPWHLCGQSTGAAILIDYLLTGLPDEKRLGQSVLFSPLIRPRAWKRSHLTYRLLKPFVKSISRRFTANSTDNEFLEFIRTRDPLQPRTLPTAWVGALASWVPKIEGAGACSNSPLIIQGDADGTVDWKHNLNVIEDKFRQPQILRIAGARHHLVNEQESIRRRYFNYLRERWE